MKGRLGSAFNTQTRGVGSPDGIPGPPMRYAADV